MNYLFKDLMAKYMQGTLTAEESKVFSDMLQSEQYRNELEQSIDIDWDKTSNFSDAETLELVYQQILIDKQTAVIKPVHRRKWIIAAAAVILFLAAGLLMISPNKKQPSVAEKQKTKDITPGKEAAILTLANGKQIVLDSTTGTITTNHGIKIINTKGLLSYEGKTESSEFVYNTIATARGNQYQLQLEDGTKVWLNSSSSLRYPIEFKGNERIVELTGEGYFEVAHNSNKPFHVKVNDMEVTVLGTHFNINSYSDEPAIKTTLLEGKVIVKKGQKFIYLRPGQQAVTTTSTDDLRVENNIDVNEVVAWKNGWFEFNNSTIESVMKQISRWYDVDVEYLGKKSDIHFVGTVSRKENVSAVLKMIEQTGAVRFQIKGRKIEVMK